MVNKTPITYSTNREIGGAAASICLDKSASNGQVDSVVLDRYLETRWINVTANRNDDFNAFIINRASILLDAIAAMGKHISGRDSEDGINSFRSPLVSTQ